MGLNSSESHHASRGIASLPCRWTVNSHSKSYQTYSRYWIFELLYSEDLSLGKGSVSDGRYQKPEQVLDFQTALSEDLCFASIWTFAGASWTSCHQYSLQTPTQGLLFGHNMEFQMPEQRWTLAGNIGQRSNSDQTEEYPAGIPNTYTAMQIPPNLPHTIRRN